MADKQDKEQAEQAAADAEQAAADLGVPTAEQRANAARIPSTDGGPAPAEPTSAEDSAGLMPGQT